MVRFLVSEVTLYSPVWRRQGFEGQGLVINERVRRLSVRYSGICRHAPTTAMLARYFPLHLRLNTCHGPTPQP